MPITFSANEILEMAKKIERNGAAFYRKAAENHADGKTLLLRLADDEDQHLAAFEAMQSALTKKEATATTFDPDDEVRLYLDAMANGQVFDTTKDPSATIDGSSSLRDILKTALGLEKASIVFYLGLRAMVSDDLSRKRVDDIINEEMLHMRLLSENLTQVNA